MQHLSPAPRRPENATASLLFVFLVTSQVIAAGYNGRVVGIIDGDTLEVLNGYHAERICLSGIDCPEKGQAFGNNAAHAASALVFGKDVTVQTHNPAFLFRGVIELTSRYP